MSWYKKAQMNRLVTVQDAGGYQNIVPIIMLRGKWLMNAGFYPKDKLNVSVSPESITLSIAEKSDMKREEQRIIEEDLEQRKREQREKGSLIKIPKIV